MPTFKPPLAHTSVVPIPADDSSHQFVQLDFYLTFDPAEDSSGSWEIWTDLPQTDDQGKIVSQPGEWHSAAFAPMQKEKQLVNGHTHESTNSHTVNTIHLPATQSSVKDASHAAQTLSYIVPATPGQSYSYTYRRVPDQGDIQWLGGLGGNGFIKLQVGQDDVEDELKTSGEWSGQLPGADDLQWSGIAVEYDEKLSSSPRIISLPTTQPAAPVLALLQASGPIHQSPFSHLRATSRTLPSRPATHHLGIVGDLFAPLSLAAASALPLASIPGKSATYGTSQRMAKDAVKVALQSKDSFRLLDVKGSLGSLDISVVFITPSIGDPKTSSIAVYAPHIENSLSISVELPETSSFGTPLAILGPNGIASYIHSATEETKQEVDLHLEAGSVAQILRLAEFIELRSDGGAESIWLAAPDAVSFEVGEEEIDIPQTRVEKPALLSAPLLDKPIQLGVNPKPDDNAHFSESEVSHSEPRNNDPVPGPQAKIEPSWSLLDAIGHFFINIWQFILGIFGAQSAVETDDRDGEGEENDHRAKMRDGTHTPADETTPLLSENLSRATSSTAFSPLASPGSDTTAKLPSSPSNNLISVTELMAKTAEQPDEEVEAPIANTVEIRSYALASFARSPPFTFLLPNKNKIDFNKLRFAYKLKTASEKEWKTAHPTSTKADGASLELVELQVGQAYDGEHGQEWQVQIERI